MNPDTVVKRSIVGGIIGAVAGPIAFPYNRADASFNQRVVTDSAIAIASIGAGASAAVFNPYAFVIVPIGMYALNKYIDGKHKK
jgi:hypothetical protein